MHRNLSTPKKPVAGSGSSFVAPDSYMDSQGATRLNDATIVRQQPLSVSGLFTRPPTANNVRFLYFLIFVCMYACMKVHPDCIFNDLQPQPGMRSVKNEDVASACSSVDALGRLYGMNIVRTITSFRLYHTHTYSFHTYITSWWRWGSIAISAKITQSLTRSRRPYSFIRYDSKYINTIQVYRLL